MKDKIYRFEIGEAVEVYSTYTGARLKKWMRVEPKIVNTGTIVKVTSVEVLFEGKNQTGELYRWSFRRKGLRWIQDHADHLELRKITNG